MKAIISFSILFFLPVIDTPGTRIQKHNKPTQADSIPDHSIIITSKLNTVKIITDSRERKNTVSITSKLKDLNSIEINESNSVVINKRKGGKVIARQNGP